MAAPAPRQVARSQVVEAEERLVDLSHRIHGHPELAFQEEQAAAWVGEALEDAGLALAPLADDLGLTVKVIGTPAEERGGGKCLLLERGAFDGVHAAMMV